jgi:hypothetical protein
MANQLMQPIARSLPYRGFAVPQHPQVLGSFGQQMPLQASAFNPVPATQGASTNMTSNFVPNTGMHAAGIANDIAHPPPPVNYAPAPPMQQLGWPMPPHGYAWSSAMPQSGFRTSLPSHAAQPGSSQPGFSTLPPRYGPTSGPQQPSLSAPYSLDQRSLGESACKSGSISQGVRKDQLTSLTFSVAAPASATPRRRCVVFRSRA